MTILNAIREFYNILTENDEYIGFAADVILSEDTQSNVVNGTSLTLQMKRLSSSQRKLISNTASLVTCPVRVLASTFLNLESQRSKNVTDAMA